MAKYTPSTISSGFNSTTELNNEFNTIATIINDEVLSRDNPVSEPNQMENDIDMNSNRIINAPLTPNSTSELASKYYVDSLLSGTTDSGSAQLRIDLADTANGEGASLIGVEDAGSNFAGTDVESVLTEIDSRIKSSKRNAIINGGFDLWLRGTSQTSSGYGSDDRWVNSHSGSSKTASQQTFTLGQTDVPGNPEFYNRTVVTTSAGAGNYVNKTQRIEGVKTFSGENVTLSFYAKADATKDIATEFLQSFGSGGAPSADVSAIGVTTHALTTSWQKFEVAVPITSLSGKTLGTDEGDTLELIFWFDAGSTYDARTNTLGQQSGTFEISNIQVEPGIIATDFEQRTLAEETGLAKRYARELVDQSAGVAFLYPGQCTASTTAEIAIAIDPPMRGLPSITVSAAASFDITDSVGTDVACSGVTTSNITRNNFRFNATVAAGLSAGDATNLRGDATPASIFLNSEL